MHLGKKIATLAMIGLMGVSSLFSQTAYASEKPAYLKSVTYFGDEWPINYWGSEDKDMAANFAKIKADGFNSIILVVPWREFQPAENGKEFNEAAFERLNQVMHCAAEYDLWVVLRIGYTWDYYGRAELPERFTGILNETGDDRYMWLRYCEEIYKTVSAHPNFHSGFITWEDFWDFVHNMGRDVAKSRRKTMAWTSGYQDYLREHYTLNEISRRYGETFSSFTEVYLPYRDMEAAELFYEFYDRMLNKFLADSQTKFPGLSMEVRADGDPVYRKDGSMYYYSHDITYPCDGAEYSALMYSVSMGQINEGNRISAAQALASMNHNMNWFTSKSGKKFFAEQLLYMDSTEQFSYNTQILEDETDDFVRELAPILQQTTMGYGLWVYRNYVNNCVYNGQFGLGTTGWKFHRNSAVEDVNGVKMAHLGKSGIITQELNGRMTGGPSIHVELYAAPEFQGADLTVELGEAKQEIKVTEAGTYKIQFPWSRDHRLRITAGDGVFLDDIRVYTYEQFGRIYDKEGNEQDLADDFRILNSRLP